MVGRVWRVAAVVVACLLLAAAWPRAGEASRYSEQATVYNCDGTEWAFRFSRLPDGSVGVGYGYAPIGGDRAAVRWSDDVSIGGSVASEGDVSAACIVGKVWVFARFAAPIDGTGRLYERHGWSGDLANGYGGGWYDWWYHWR